MKVIATSTDTIDPPRDKMALMFRRARFELLAKLANRGYYACSVAPWDYTGDGMFRQHLFPVDFDKLLYETRGQIRVDALYDKALLMPHDLATMTDWRIQDICNSKIRTAQVFSDLQPKTVFVTDEAEAVEKISLVVGDGGLVVIKPDEGYGGIGIRIEPVEVLRKNPPQVPFLAQEYIDSSGGVAGLVDGIHDVRAIVLNGEIIGGLLHTPKAGSLLSNTHLGGKYVNLAQEDLPADLIPLVEAIDKKLPNKPRFYAADFFYSKARDRWYLVELNSSPGLDPTSDGPKAEKVMDLLADTLVKMAD